jgi:hypothetical protein
LLSRLPKVRPEVAQILQAAINLLNVPRSSSRSNTSETPRSGAEQFLPRTIQDAIVDEIESRYGGVSSMTISQFAQEIGTQPSDSSEVALSANRLIELLQGNKLEQDELRILQRHLYKSFMEHWTFEELLRIAQAPSPNKPEDRPRS